MLGSPNQASFLRIESPRHLPQQGAMPQVSMSLEGRGEASGGRSSKTQALGCLLRHILLLIHCPGSHLSLRLWLHTEPKLDMKKYCRLVDIFYNYNLTTGAYWHLQFTRRKGLLMIAAARKGPRVDIADINSKHN